MTLLRTLLICVLGLAITSDASAAKAKKKKNASSLEGIVTAVEAGKDSVTLTVKASAGKKKKNAAPEANAPEKKVLVTKECKIEKVSGKKGQQETKTAALADIQKDARVAIALKTGAPTETAEKVQILEQGKKKKKKANAN